MASYPDAIPVLVNPTTANNLSSPSHALQHSNANDEIEAIAGTLGVNPEGTFDTVALRLAALGEGLPVMSTATNGQYLTNDGADASWGAIIQVPAPSTATNGQYLTNDGTDASWASVDALPAQSTATNGQFLTSDGTDASWADLDALPAMSTATNGQFLTNDGADASWDDLPACSVARSVVIKVVGDTDSFSTGDGQVYYTVPDILNGMNLTGAAAHVYTASASTASIVTVQVRNVTQTADMLSTRITIDATETDSSTAAAAAVIDTGNDDVATADVIAIDVDVAPAGALGLEVRLKFETP